MRRLELYHDILAKKIFEKASSEEKNRLKMERLVAERYRAYKDSGELLSQQALNYISPYLPDLNLEQKYLDFIRESEERLQRKRRRRRWITGLTIFILAVFLGVAMIALFSVRAEQREQEALLFATRSRLALDEGEVSRAFRLAQYAYEMGKDSLPRAMAASAIIELYNSGLQCDVAHEGDIVSLDVLAERKFVLTASADGILKVWQSDSCQLLREYESEIAPMQATFCPDTEYPLILLLGTDGEMVLYDFEQGVEVFLPAKEEAISAARFSKDGRFFAYGNDKGGAFLHAVAEPVKRLFSFEMEKSIQAVDFSSTGQWLVASPDSIQLLGLSHLPIPIAFPPFSSGIKQMESARFIIEAGLILIEGGGEMRISDYRGRLPDGAYRSFAGAVMVPGLLSTKVKESAFPPHQALVYSLTGERQELRYFQLPDRDKPLLQLQLTDSLTFMGFSEDGASMILATSDERFEVLGLPKGISRAKLKGKIEQARIMPGNEVVVGVVDGTAHVWRLPKKSKGIKNRKAEEGELNLIIAYFDRVLRTFSDI